VIDVLLVLKDNVATIAFTLFVVWDCVYSLRNRPRQFDMFRQWSWRLTGLNFVVLLLLGSITLFIASLPWPPLLVAIGGFSWVAVLTNNQAINLAAAPLTIPFIGIPILALLILRMPDAADYEENAFRKGTLPWSRSRSSVIKRSFLFGLLHMTMGIPLVACLTVLSGMGFYFTILYWRGGVKRSAQAHFQSNVVLLLLAGFLLQLTAISPYLEIQ